MVSASASDQRLTSRPHNGYPGRMTVTLAADIVVLAPDSDLDLGILLIQRADDSDAHPGDWALPGGLVEDDETSREAASRELAEEVTIFVPPERLTRIDVYDTPGRDPRGRVVSVAYGVTLPTQALPVAADDAKHAQWVPVREALTLKLAFDHCDVIVDGVRRLGFGRLVS